MPRLMSVTLTEQAVVERRKTVTRRLGWAHLQVGDELDLCRKVMGRKRPDGSVEPLVRLHRVRVVSVGQEYLYRITDAEVVREGLGWRELRPYADPSDGPASQIAEGSLASAFVAFFCQHMRCNRFTEVNRIEWEYIDPALAELAEFSSNRHQDCDCASCLPPTY